MALHSTALGAKEFSMAHTRHTCERKYRDTKSGIGIAIQGLRGSDLRSIQPCSPENETLNFASQLGGFLKTFISALLTQFDSDSI